MLSFRAVVGACAVMASFAMIAACGDHEDDGGAVCRKLAGPTEARSACTTGDQGRARLAAAETFRSHVVASSSAAGIALAQFDQATTWLFDCLADAVSTTAVTVLVGGSSSSVVTCGRWGEASTYTFANGDYRLDLRRRVTVLPQAPTDVESSATLRFTFTKPVGNFAVGAVVPFDLGLSETYLVGPRLAAAAAAAGNVAALAYDRPGPLVELLGLGANPPNPIPLTNENVKAINAAAKDYLSISGHTRADLTDCGHRSVIELAVDTTPVASDVRPRLVTATTTADGTAGPRVVARTWSVVHPAGAPDAPIGHVDGDVIDDTEQSSVAVTLDASVPGNAALSLTCGAP